MNRVKPVCGCLLLPCCHNVPLWVKSKNCTKDASLHLSLPPSTVPLTGLLTLSARCIFEFEMCFKMTCWHPQRRGGRRLGGRGEMRQHGIMKLKEHQLHTMQNQHFLLLGLAKAQLKFEQLFASLSAYWCICRIFPVFFEKNNQS